MQKKWYSITRGEILSAGGGKILKRYKGSHITALAKVYPELTWEAHKFFLSKEGRNAPQQQREFFDKFAISKQFDPLDPEKWYSTSYKDIIRAGGGSILTYFKSSHITALIKLYPELILKKENFYNSKEGWKAPHQQRQFFDEFAKAKKFDPLDDRKWYCITREEILASGGRAILKYYGRSHITALIGLYPELMLKKENFSNSKSSKEG